MSSIEFILTDGERSHPLWYRLKSHMEMKLNEARVKNDDATLTADATAQLRGQISCLKNLIALGNEPPVID